VSVDDVRFDPARIIEVLERHGVDYVLVGGIAAQAHGATRTTNDLDCVPRSTIENLQRLAQAMRELGARLRLGGMSDDEASQLPVVLDADMLARLRVSTWVTDAGLFDVLMDIPARQGRRRGYDELADRSDRRETRGATIRVASLDDIIESKEVAARAKDHEALPELRALAEVRRGR
jgi:hypothetical protein